MMRKTVLTLAIALGLCPALAMGQDRTADPQQPARTEARAERMTERMARTYNLDEKQKSKLLKANKAYVEAMNEVAQMPPRRPRHAPRHLTCDNRRERPERPPLTDEQREQLKKQKKEKREKANLARADYDKQLKKIMTDEQYQDYRNRQKQIRERRQQAPRHKEADERPTTDQQTNS